ncbi:Neutral sphingomyelinase [Spironucleus salmonicida]|uniref:sphingomyelin phosphodiesterase n=1 Tax=Spironucleus salmonicida TaxID=348837 RepID=V6LFJ7_9EUKA|nr:Neutral sphingomyelinase [Spironucleus salmonicida]|eukprot:EST43315.1 Endonuclease/exonuclease/phosphatase family protein [Spironucleus salmonicida]
MNVKLLQYNIFLRPLFVNTNGDDYTEQRINFILDNIGQYDILCFQEFFQQKSVKQICDKFKHKLTQLGFIYQIEGPKRRMNPIRILDSGLLVASKLPFISQNIIEFKNHGYGNDYFIHKGFIHFQIQQGNTKLDIFNIHTQASYYHHNLSAQQQETDKYFVTRYKQLQQIKKFADKLTSQNIIFVGDLNIDYFSSPYIERGQYFNFTSQFTTGPRTDPSFQYTKMLEILSGKYKIIDAFLESSEPPVTFGDGSKQDDKIIPVDTWLTYKPDYLSMQRLDYILHYDFHVKVSCQLKKFEMNYQQIKFASDHYAIEADISLQ